MTSATPPPPPRNGPSRLLPPLPPPRLPPLPTPPPHPGPPQPGSPQDRARPIHVGGRDGCHPSRLPTSTGDRPTGSAAPTPCPQALGLGGCAPPGSGQGLSGGSPALGALWPWQLSYSSVPQFPLQERGRHSTCCLIGRRESPTQWMVEECPRALCASAHGTGRLLHPPDYSAHGL